MVETLETVNVLTLNVMPTSDESGLDYDIRGWMQAHELFKVAFPHSGKSLHKKF